MRHIRRSLSTAVLAFLLSCGTVLAQPNPRALQDFSPEGVLRYFSTYGTFRELTEEERSLVAKRMRAEQEALDKLLTECLRLPEDPEAWAGPYEPWDLPGVKLIKDPDRAPGPPPNHPRTRAYVAFKLTSHLEPARRDALLVHVFRQSLRLWQEAERRLAAAGDALRAAEAAGADDVEAHKKRVAQLSETASMWGGYLGDGVERARRFKTQALIDPILEMYEAGIVQNRGDFTRYVIHYAGEREDIFPRLKKLQEDPKTPREIKDELKRTFKWYYSTVVRAGDDGQQLAQADPAAAQAQPVPPAAPLAPTVPPGADPPGSPASPDPRR